MPPNLQAVLAIIAHVDNRVVEVASKLTENELEMHEFIGDRVLNLYIATCLANMAGVRAASRVMGTCVSNAHYKQFLMERVPSCSEPSGDNLEAAVSIIHEFYGKSETPALRLLASDLVTSAKWSANPAADLAFHNFLMERKEAVAKREVKHNYKGELFELTVKEQTTYTLTVVCRPPEAPVFKVNLVFTLRNLPFTAEGLGVSMKDAEQRACAYVLVRVLEMRPDAMNTVGYVSAMLSGSNPGHRDRASEIRRALECQSEELAHGPGPF